MPIYGKDIKEYGLEFITVVASGEEVKGMGRD